MGSAMEEGSPIYFVNIGRRDGDDVRIGDRLFTHVVLQYFYEGEVEVQGEGGEWERCLAPGVFVTFPKVHWNYGPPPGKTWSHLWIGLTGKGLERLLDQGMLELRQRGFFLPLRSPQEFHRRVELLMRLSTAESGSPQAKSAVLLLEKVLRMLYQNEPELGRGNPQEKYREALLALGERLHRHPGQLWDFRKQAAALSISYSLFRRNFRDLFSMPPGTVPPEGTPGTGTKAPGGDKSPHRQNLPPGGIRRGRAFPPDVPTGLRPRPKGIPGKIQEPGQAQEDRDAPLTGKTGGRRRLGAGQNPPCTGG